MKLRWLLLVVGLSLSSAVFAQSSVQLLFGILDSGITYVSNQNGKSNVFYQSGTMVPTIVGLRGTEDLGGGLRAIFKLVDNFNDGTGAMVNGLLFGKEAWVGLQDQKYGTLTLGNQFDYMFRYMTIDRWGYMLKYNPVYYTQQGPFSKLGLPGGAFDFDRTAGSITTNNSVSYESPIFHGFGFGAMYGLGGQAGSTTQDSTQSFGLRYSNALVTLDAAYTYTRFPGINNGNNGIRNWGIGGRVNIYNAAIDAMFTNTENTYNGGRVNVYEIGGYYSLTGVDEVTLEYQYDQGNAVLSDNKAQQVNLTYAHDLSKRTLVYVTLAHQWAGGDGQALATIIGSTASSSNGSQTLARVGLTVRF
jgi:predicted porin